MTRDYFRGIKTYSRDQLFLPSLEMSAHLGPAFLRRY